MQPKRLGNNTENSIYTRQNRMIHMARAKLGLSLEDCRELARHIGGKASISSLSLEQRKRLIDLLNEKGADVHNPPLNGQEGGFGSPTQSIRPDKVYTTRLAYWNQRFPYKRPQFASNRQLAWIQTLWELDFDDGRAGDGLKGLRGFIFRQTRHLEDGPVSDLAFLKAHHVKAVISPLLRKAKQRRALSSPRKTGG